MLFQADDHHSTPFPHALSTELLSPAEFASLRDDFPVESDFHSKHASYGSVRRGTPQFNAILDRSSAWQHFYDRVNSKAFFDHCLGLFADDLERNGARVNLDNYRFSRRPAPPYRTRVRSLPNALYYVQRGVERSVPRRWINEVLGRDELYLRMTFSCAGAGYGKEIHRDRKHGLLLILIYFDDLEDCGGELELYRRRSDVVPGQITGRRVPVELVTHAATLPCRANTGVMMLNTPEAFHAVTPMVEGAPMRRFVGLVLSKRFSRDAWGESELR